MDLFVDISGLDRAAVLAALFNQARPGGAASLNAAATDGMSIKQARALLKVDPYIHCHQGRVLKVDLPLEATVFWTALYDKANGYRAGQSAIDAVRCI